MIAVGSGTEFAEVGLPLGRGQTSSLRVVESVSVMNAIGPQACPCGSGLAPERCCQLDVVALTSAAVNPKMLAIAEQAADALRNGATGLAEQLSLQVLECSPSSVTALAVLAEIRKATGQTRAVESLLRRIVNLDPNNFAATAELGRLLLARGSLTEAELHARNAVRMAPENPQSHNLMGMILTETHRPQAGEYHYRRVLELTAVRDPILLANLGWCLKNQGKMEEARSLYCESVAAAPNVPQTLIGFARLEEADRNFDAASDLLDRAERIAPGDPSVLLARAVMLGRKREYQQALATLESIATRSQDRGLGPDELLEKGRLLDRMGYYDEAFAAFEDGKRKVRELSGNAYLADYAKQLGQRLQGFFTSGRLRLLPRASRRDDCPQPIFILGFPRSGTTLVEQMLSAHPCISAGDELPIVGEIADIMPRILDSPLTYPEVLAELWMGDHREELDNLRDYYLQKARQLGAIKVDMPWFTDKMPLNEMHMGLIGLLFPEAPLIHVLRHPLDVVLSAFSNHMTHGYFCSYSLESAARHYALVMDLVQHYRRELALRYLPVRYEDIVEAQEPTLRRLLDFIGEPFDQRCLQFHENRRYARTASYAQVAEKLYDSSRFRHRHYLRQLDPVIPILQPIIDRLGYSIADGSSTGGRVDD